MADVVRPLERIREIAKSMESGMPTDVTTAYSSVAALVDIVKGENDAQGNDTYISEKLNTLLYHARCLAKLDDDKRRPGFQHLEWLLMACDDSLRQFLSLGWVDQAPTTT